MVIKKTIVLSLSLGLCFMSNGFAISRADEERAANIQQQEILKNKTKSTRYKIKQVESEIKQNETKIKSLESQRSDLDHDLAIALQLKEDSIGWFENRRLQGEIYKIKTKIDLNEGKIRALKEKRNDLDHELAVLFQLQEM